MINGAAHMQGHQGQHVRTTIATLSAVTVITVFSAALPTAAQAKGGRQLMEHCVDQVLARLAQARAAETQVGPMVLSECDGALQAVLADAIESGEAPAFCKVGFCITLARSRATQEATEEYRRRIRS
jgi:hypothetical protein